MSNLTLIGSATSPFVRKCRIAAQLLGLDVTFQLEQQWKSGSLVPDFNPLAKVPILVTPDLGSVFDSRVVIAELERRSGKTLRPSNQIDAIIDMRLEALGDGIGEATALVVQETWRPENARSIIWSDRQLAKVRRGITALAIEPTLLSSNPLSPSIGTIAAICALDFVSFWLPEEPWAQDNQSLSDLVLRMSDTAPFVDTKPMRSPGFLPPQF
jgi:glutathione S-transferase